MRSNCPFAVSMRTKTSTSSTATTTATTATTASLAFARRPSSFSFRQPMLLLAWLLAYLCLCACVASATASATSVSHADDSHHDRESTGRLGFSFRSSLKLHKRFFSAKSQELGDDSSALSPSDDGQHAILERAPPALDKLENNEPVLRNLDMGDVLHFVCPKDILSKEKSSAGNGLPPVVGEMEKKEELTRRVVIDGSSEDEDGEQGEDEDECEKEKGPVSASTTGKEDAAHLDVKQKAKLPLTKRRKSAKTALYITATTCLQPSPKNKTAGRVGHDHYGGPPQLNLYISPTIERPGPDNKTDAEVIPFDQGYANVTIYPDGDVYMGVAADNSTDFEGIYNFELAASIDREYHVVDADHPFLMFFDGDSTSALLRTNDTTQAEPGSESYQQWMGLKPAPFTMFAQNTNYSADILGVQKSVCGLSKNAQVSNLNHVTATMVNRGVTDKPKEQFHATNLNRSSQYWGFLALPGNSSSGGSKKGAPGGGGKVWKSMNFSTKSDGNCALLFDLDFCDDISYAVPSNPHIHRAELAHMYDKLASRRYQNFTYSLQQVPCNATSSASYSFATNCTECAKAYKQWVCAITIPRCEDFSKNHSFLAPRGTGQKFINGSSLPSSDPLRHSVASNSSRNSIIDTRIKPGPYKEILPCQDLCHKLVRKCPTTLGFRCPQGRYLNASYGYRDPSGDITCSYLGAAYFMSRGVSIVTMSPWAILGAIIAFAFGWAG